MLQKTTQGHIQGHVIQDHVPEASHVLGGIQNRGRGIATQIIQGHYHVNGQDHPIDAIQGLVLEVGLGQITM